MVGVGSQYAIAALDADGNYLDGSKTYSVTLPQGIPAKDFWSFVLDDPETYDHYVNIPMSTTQGDFDKPSRILKTDHKSLLSMG